MNDQPIIPWLTWQRRAWLYEVTKVLAPMFAAYGIGSGEQWALIVSAIGAILGVTVASTNTSITEPRNAPASEGV